MPKASVFIATSLDGYIARTDGAIDWLEHANKRVPAGEDCGYGAFISTVDVLVMGRNTFEQALGFKPWPYAGKRVVVLSRGAVRIPEALAGSVSATSEAPAVLVARLAREGAQHLYIDGGLTIQAFLAAGLLDEVTITTIPVLLGSGKPLFGPLAADVTLERVDTRSWAFGFVQNRYRIARTT